MTFTARNSLVMCCKGYVEKVDVTSISKDQMKRVSYSKSDGCGVNGCFESCCPVPLYLQVGSADKDTVLWTYFFKKHEAAIGAALDRVLYYEKYGAPGTQVDMNRK